MDKAIELLVKALNSGVGDVMDASRVEGENAIGVVVEGEMYFLSVMEA